jgi:hypothetical protein
MMKKATKKMSGEWMGILAKKLKMILNAQKKLSIESIF